MWFVMAALAAAPPTMKQVNQAFEPCGQLRKLTPLAEKGELDSTQRACLEGLFASPDAHKAIRWKAGNVVLTDARLKGEARWVRHAEALFTLHPDPVLAREVSGYIGETEKNLSLWQKRSKQAAPDASEVKIRPSESPR